MHVHFFSPPPSSTTRIDLPIEQCWKNVGANTGNLLFINALVRQVQHDKATFGYGIDVDFVNQSVDLIVIPAANWLQPGTDLTGWWRALRDTTPPIIMAGIGAHSLSFEHVPKLRPGTVRFMQMVSDRSKVISTRGHYTTKVLKHYGFENAVTTGCPSLFTHCTPDFPEVRQSSDFRMSQVAIQATRHAISEDRKIYETGRAHIERTLFQAARFSSAHYIFQSEREEVPLVLGRASSELTEQQIENLLFYYGVGTLDDLGGFFKRSRVFFEIDEWFAFLRTMSFSIGSRLHGCIAALTAGTEACLLTHDTRTRELAEFAQLPSIEAGDLKQSIDDIGLHEAIVAARRRCSTEPFAARYREIYRGYREVLERNGVAHNLA